MDTSTRSPEKKKIPELLAPGSMEAFFAAVAAGADAVYLSGKRFGARKFAQNFSEEEIEEAITYAHARGVRVYVTVNTLVHDRELPGVAEYLVRLYAMGVDAMLVQDPGVAALARTIVPGLTLHASTQLTIHNADGVRWAHATGLLPGGARPRALPWRGGGDRTGNRRYRGRPRSLRPRGTLLQLLRPVPALIRDRGRSGTGACAPSRAGRNIPLSRLQWTGMDRPTGQRDVPLPGPVPSSRQKTSARTARSPARRRYGRIAEDRGQDEVAGVRGDCRLHVPARPRCGCRGQLCPG